MYMTPPLLHCDTHCYLHYELHTSHVTPLWGRNAYYECFKFVCVAGGSIYERAFAGDVTYKRVIDLLKFAKQEMVEL